MNGTKDADGPTMRTPVAMRVEPSGMIMVPSTVISPIMVRFPMMEIVMSADTT